MQQKRLLMIEDNDGDAELMRIAISSMPEPYELVRHDTFAKGVVALKDQSFDLLLLDLNLPDSDGMQTVTKALQVTSDTPVIVFTGATNDADGEAAISLGAQDYVNKGAVDAKALSRIFRFSIERHRLRRENLKLLQVYNTARVKAETAEANAIAALARADKASQLKTEFLANISHEIRTPLNGIIGMAQLMRKTELSDKQEKYMERIISSGNSLAAIISNILDISKIETGHLEIQKASMGIDYVVAQAIKEVCISENKVDLDINCVFHVDAKSPVVGDANRIKQVLTYLLDNAIKFAGEGAIVVCVEPGKDGCMKFSVTDSGPGVSTNDQDEIFKRFRQADGSKGRKYGGAGLGLAISKNLVELMGGEIGVISAPGHGASFWFQLPLQSVKEQETAA